jgi:6-phosphofructokinase 1
MNAAIRAIVRAALARNLHVIGIRRGYAGVLENDMPRLGLRSVTNIVHRGGTILETRRCEEMKTIAGRAKAIKNLREQGIEGLIAIGGDGTFRGATALAQEGGIKVVGVPGTIDNDVYGTDATIGFDTAVNTAVEAIDKIRDTAESLERLFFVEVMGRTRGFIALHVGVAGGAEQILIPETKENGKELCKRLERSFSRGKRSAIVVVAEGDEAGGAFAIARQVSACLKTDYRVCILGHIQRGGTPTARDRILASKLGVAAVEALVSGKDGCMVGEVKGEIAYTPLQHTWERTKDLEPSLLALMKVLAT